MNRTLLIFLAVFGSVCIPTVEAADKVTIDWDGRTNNITGSNSVKRFKFESRPAPLNGADSNQKTLDAILADITIPIERVGECQKAVNPLMHNPAKTSDLVDKIRIHLTAVQAVRDKLKEPVFLQNLKNFKPEHKRIFIMEFGKMGFYQLLDKKDDFEPTKDEKELADRKQYDSLMKEEKEAADEVTRSIFSKDFNVIRHPEQQPQKKPDYRK